MTDEKNFVFVLNVFNMAKKIKKKINKKNFKKMYEKIFFSFKCI